MDINFEVYGGGDGWRSEQGGTGIETTFSSKYNALEKIPIPVALKDLCKLKSPDDRYTISSYSFYKVISEF